MARHEIYVEILADPFAYLEEIFGGDPEVIDVECEEITDDNLITDGDES